MNFKEIAKAAARALPRRSLGNLYLISGWLLVCMILALALLIKDPSSLRPFMLYLKVTMLLAAWLILRGRRLRSRWDERVLDPDDRAPVLYLRSVESDRDARFNWFFFYLPRTAIEKLVGSMRKIAPVIAVGEPGESIPHAGPLTIYLDASTWESGVADLIQKARFLIFRAEFSWCVARELYLAKLLLPPTKILFWFPDVKDTSFLEFAQKIQSYLPCGSVPNASLVRFVYFNAEWQPQIVRETWLSRLFGYTVTLWISLSPFLEDLGISSKSRLVFAVKAWTQSPMGAILLGYLLLELVDLIRNYR
ncbi:MAG TPA: hypothetical protein VHU83_15965 [Bryobacteraceae bacterium]|nr:hypothetical protein [Bryobacteraceae bacterium]